MTVKGLINHLPEHSLSFVICSKLFTSMSNNLHVSKVVLPSGQYESEIQCPLRYGVLQGVLGPAHV